MPSYRDKTISHSHSDPKIIEQIGAKNSFIIGDLVYLDVDNIYKLALSVDDQKQNIQGVIWSFPTPDSFYLRIAPGPFEYRFPIEQNFIDNFIPGNVGDRLWLSNTNPGKMVNTKTGGDFEVFVGYKTDYGFLYRPELYICCVSTDQSSSSIESSFSSEISSEESSSESVNISSSSNSSITSSSISSLVSVSSLISSLNSSSSSASGADVCIYTYVSEFDCSLDDWTNPVLTHIYCSNTFPGPLDTWIKNQCIATYITLGLPCIPDSSTTSSLTSSISGDFFAGCSLTPPSPPIVGPVRVQLDYDTCCSSSSLGSSTTSSVNSSETSSNSSTTPPISSSSSNSTSSEESSSSQMCNVYTFEAEFDPATCTWGAIEELLPRITTPVNCAPNLGWSYSLCFADIAIHVPFGDPVPTPPALTDPPEDCPCSSSSNSSISSVGSSQTSISSDSSNTSEESSETLCDGQQH